jgi:hypothetical protein
MTGQNLSESNDWKKETDPRWQPHVMALLWTFLALAAILIGALLYGKGHGLFQSVFDQSAPDPPSWQTGWP